MTSVESRDGELAVAVKLGPQKKAGSHEGNPCNLETMTPDIDDAEGSCYCSVL